MPKFVKTLPEFEPNDVKIEPLGTTSGPKSGPKWNPELGMEQHVNKYAKIVGLGASWHDFGLHFGGHNDQTMTLKLSLFFVTILASLLIPKTSKKDVILSRKNQSAKKNTKHVKMCRFARRPSEKHDFEGPRPLK